MSRREVLRLMVAAGASLVTRGWGTTEAMASEPATAVLTRRILSSGETVPVIGLGTWQTFDVGSSSAERVPLEEVLGTFVAMGGRVIDSSPMYGNSEEVVGDIAAKLCGRRSIPPRAGQTAAGVGRGDRL